MSNYDDIKNNYKKNIKDFTQFQTAIFQNIKLLKQIFIDKMGFSDYMIKLKPHFDFTTEITAAHFIDNKINISVVSSIPYIKKYKNMETEMMFTISQNTITFHDKTYSIDQTKELMQHIYKTFMDDRRPFIYNDTQSTPISNETIA